MLGIQTPGKLAATSAADAQASEEIFFNKYVKPRQKILENFWNKIMKYNGLAEVQIINTNVFNKAAIDSNQAGISTDNSTSKLSPDGTAKISSNLSSGSISPASTAPAAAPKGDNSLKYLKMNENE